MRAFFLRRTPELASERREARDGSRSALLFAAYALAAKTARVRARQYCMASERKDAVEIRGCCSVACCPSAPQAEAISCFKIEEVLRCWRELVNEQCGEGEGALLRSVVGSSHICDH